MVHKGKDTEELVPKVNVKELKGVQEVKILIMEPQPQKIQEENLIMVHKGKSTEELVPEANVKDFKGLQEVQNLIMEPQLQQVHKGVQEEIICRSKCLLYKWICGVLQS